MCHELHILHYRLSQHKPVERVSMQGWQTLDEGSVASRHVEQVETSILKLDNRLMSGKRRCVRPAELVLDGDFP